MVNCWKCKRSLHEICVMYHDAIPENTFICKNCAVPYLDHYDQFKAKHLPVSSLSTEIENRVNEYLKNDFADSKVIVRVVSSHDKTTHVQKNTSVFFKQSGHAITHPYRMRAIMAFQSKQGVDVLFFAMYVQEYSGHGSNRGTVYISYLDTVNFFEPANHRTRAYQEILLSYMKHMKNLGFESVHIWACPPRPGDDYIFYIHPNDQKTLSKTRLQKWYAFMIQKGMKDGIIEYTEDILASVLRRKFSSPAHLPYFDGDFWPDVIESIVCSHKKSPPTDKSIFDKLIMVMKKEKESFFVIGLQSLKESVLVRHFK